MGSALRVAMNKFLKIFADPRGNSLFFSETARKLPTLRQYSVHAVSERNTWEDKLASYRRTFDQKCEVHGHASVSQV